MFSKYKKSGPAPAPEPAEKVAAAAKPVNRGLTAEEAESKVVRKVGSAGQSPCKRLQPMDKERKKKERMQDIKLELHRALLDNLNLAALEHATEAGSASGDQRDRLRKILQEKRNIVLTREDRHDPQSGALSTR